MAKEEMEEIFKGVGENDNITEGYKEANIIALDDYIEDEPVVTSPIVKINENEDIYREHDTIFNHNNINNELFIGQAEL